jgi:hypothetical protein
MLTLLTLAVAAAAPAAAPPLKLAAPALTLFSVEPQLGAFLSEHLAQQIKLAGAEVVTEREIASLLGMERQKQLLGCSEQASNCMAELANALGADAVLLGDVAKVGERLQLNLKIIASVDGKTLAVFSDNVSGEETALLALTRGANQLATQAATSLGRTLTPKFRETTDLRKVAIIPLGASVVFLGAGAGLLAASNSTYQYVVTGKARTDVEGRSAISLGSTEQTLGGVGLAVGTAALAAAAGLFFFGAPATPTVTPTAGGATVGFMGALP